MRVIALVPLFLLCPAWSRAEEKPTGSPAAKDPPSLSESFSKISSAFRNAFREQKVAPADKTKEYQKTIRKLVGQRWVAEVRKQASGLKSEIAELAIQLNSAGKVTSITVTSKDTTRAYAELCEKAVRDAQNEFPRVPPEILDPKTGTFAMPMNFQLY